jgi:hypothetical protein
VVGKLKLPAERHLAGKFHYPNYSLTMPTRSQVLARLSELKPRLHAKYHVTSLALFGSCAREENLPDSDIDILVDVPGSIGLNFVHLADELERELDHKVDLVSTRGLKPSIKQVIESELIHA